MQNGNCWIFIEIQEFQTKFQRTIQKWDIECWINSGSESNLLSKAISNWIRTKDAAKMSFFVKQQNQIILILKLTNGV